ncbi:MAG: hypothetical protein EBU31_06155 [Proteobacteria bacterium]|nr:hypothetical protein [Pseudomonadota bacterium]
MADELRRGQALRGGRRAEPGEPLLPAVGAGVRHHHGDRLLHREHHRERAVRLHSQRGAQKIQDVGKAAVLGDGGADGKQCARRRVDDRLEVGKLPGQSARGTAQEEHGQAHTHARTVHDHRGVPGVQDAVRGQRDRNDHDG